MLILQLPSASMCKYFYDKINLKEQHVMDFFGNTQYVC